jgi:hypothetical protein
VDAFGNATTNLRPAAKRPAGPSLEGPLELLTLRCGDTVLGGLRRTYGEVARGEPLVLVGSTGYLEIAVREGSAAAALGLQVGGEVLATWRAAGGPYRIRDPEPR